MDSAALFSLGRAVAYKINSLTERYLQERGAAPLSTFALHRYALIPAVIWALLFIRPDDIAQILATPHQIIYFFIIFIVWTFQQYAHSYRINTTSTVSVLSNLYNVLTLPLLLLAGTFFNHDTPNFFSIAAIAILALAMIIKPAHHLTNKRAQFSKPLPLIIGLICFEVVIDVVLIALSRQLLKEIPPHVFIGVFDILVLLSCLISVAYLARRQTINIQTTIKRHPVRSISIPIIFFAGSVVEFYAHAALPIYIVLAIGCLTFLMDIASDLWRHRIRFNLQTVSFIFLVLAGILLSVYSI